MTVFGLSVESFISLVNWLGITLAGVAGAFAIRHGRKQTTENPSHISTSEKPQIVGAMIDDSSIIMLSASVGALVTTLKEVDSRSGGMQRITTALEAIAHGIKQWNEFHERGEEEREKREKDRIERENDQLKRDLREATRRAHEGAHHGSSTSSSLSFDNKG